MTQRIGILLIEKTEVIIRIYEVDEKKWRLLSYQSMQEKLRSERNDLDIYAIIETIAEFFITDQAQHVTEWRACARGFSHAELQQVSLAIGISVENLTILREQELLCKGMFTELW